MHLPTSAEQSLTLGVVSAGVLLLPVYGVLLEPGVLDLDNPGLGVLWADGVEELPPPLTPILDLGFLLPPLEEQHDDSLT